MYVDKNHFQQGIGQKLYKDILLNLKYRGFHSAIGCLRPTNTASVKLHEKFGFVKCGQFKDSGFKFNQWHSTGFWQLFLKDLDSKLYENFLS